MGCCWCSGSRLAIVFANFPDLTREVVVSQVVVESLADVVAKVIETIIKAIKNRNCGLGWKRPE